MTDPKLIEAVARSDAEFDGQTWLGMSRTARERYTARATRSVAAYEAARGDGMSQMEPGLSAYAQGLRLLSLCREIGATGFRNYPAGYDVAHTLVGTGLADYAEPPEAGRQIWLKLTDSGRAMIAAAKQE